jgi:pyridinium-3,5-bisthiocarboxylic acid mononucleotide nickel chelatase
VAAAVHALGITEVWSAPVALGSGVVASAHGLLPVPAPATLALLAGADVAGIDQAGETVTPTGAALLLALDCRYGPAPAMRLAATGYGAGARNPSGRPNVLQAVLGTPPGRQAEAIVSELLIVESTVDDVTGEMLATLPGRLLDSGALDCWITPVLGKKGRPAHVITALCPPPAATSVETALLRETGSLGARRHAVLRTALPRTSTSVRVAGHPIQVKVGPHRAKPEHDDVLEVAAATGLPARTVADLAQAAITGQRMPSDEES